MYKHFIKHLSSLLINRFGSYREAGSLFDKMVCICLWIICLCAVYL